MKKFKILYLPSPKDLKLERSLRIQNMLIVLKNIATDVFSCCSCSNAKKRLFFRYRFYCVEECLKYSNFVKPDIVVASDTLAGFTGAVLKIVYKILKGRKFIFIYDSHGVPRRGFPVHIILEDFLATLLADCITVVTNYDKVFYSKFKRKVFVIPSFVNVQNIHSKPFLKRNIDFAFHGNFSYPPNREALNIIIALAKKLPNYQFVIFGAGTESLRNLPPNLHLLGFVEDPFDILMDAKFYLAPIFRGRGIITKVLDAMACGAIPLTTDFVARGIPELKYFGEMLVATDLRTFTRNVIRVQTVDCHLLNIISNLLQQQVIMKYSLEVNKVLVERVLEACVKNG